MSIHILRYLSCCTQGRSTRISCRSSRVVVENHDKVRGQPIALDDGAISAPNSKPIEVGDVKCRLVSFELVTRRRCVSVQPSVRCPSGIGRSLFGRCWFSKCRSYAKICCVR